MKMTEIPMGHVAQMAEGDLVGDLVLRGFRQAVWLTGAARMITEPVESFAFDYEDLGPFEEVFARRQEQSVWSAYATKMFNELQINEAFEVSGRLYVKQSASFAIRVGDGSRVKFERHAEVVPLYMDADGVFRPSKDTGQPVRSGEPGVKAAEVPIGNVAKMSAILSTFQENIDELTTEVKVLRDRVNTLEVRQSPERFL